MRTHLKRWSHRQRPLWGHKVISLEQVRLLESKVTKTIDYVKKVTEENTLLKGKLDTYQTKIAELEVLIQRFREDQSRIEDGILSALDRLNQFEDAVENKLSSESKIPRERKIPAESKPAGASPAVKAERKKNEAVLKPEAAEKEESPGVELDIF